MKRHTSFFAILSFLIACSAHGAQQPITTITSGTGTSGKTLKQYNDSDINPRLTKIHENITDLYTNKAATSCFGSSAAWASCFPGLTLGGGVTSYNNLTDKPIIPNELADLATDTANQRVSAAEKLTWDAKQNALGFTPENTANKGTANGYASLGSDGLVPSSQLPPLGTTYDLPSLADAQAGTSTTPYVWSPQRVAQAIAALDLKSNAVGTLNYTASVSPSDTDILGNKYITNYGATGTIVITLPVVSYEICRGILTSSAQIIQVTPPAGEAFDLSGTTLSADQSFAGPATVGAKAVVCRQRNAAGAWIWSIDVVRGTWAGI